MNKLVDKFLNEQLPNNKLNSDKSFNELEDEFNSYVFKVYLYGYVKKTIVFSAMQIKKKNNLIYKNEDLNLNVVDPNFNEERINFIADNQNGELDTVNEFNLKQHRYNYDEISHNEHIVNAINSLTDRQKEIIYRCVILGERDTLVAKKIGISKQGVNKTKLTSINKLRKKLYASA